MHGAPEQVTPCAVPGAHATMSRQFLLATSHLLSRQAPKSRHCGSGWLPKEQRRSPTQGVSATGSAAGHDVSPAMPPEPAAPAEPSVASPPLPEPPTLAPELPPEEAPPVPLPADPPALASAPLPVEEVSSPQATATPAATTTSPQMCLEPLDHRTTTYELTPRACRHQALRVNPSGTPHACEDRRHDVRPPAGPRKRGRVGN